MQNVLIDGYSKNYRAEHEGEIFLHQSAKKALSGLPAGQENYEKFPDRQREYGQITVLLPDRIGTGKTTATAFGSFIPSM